MKKFFSNIYTNLTNSTLKELIFGFLVMAIFFLLSATPSIVYFHNSKYYGDANDAYAYMNYISIGLCGAGILGIFGYLGYNTFKK